MSNSFLVESKGHKFGGDVRIGDINGDSTARHIYLSLPRPFKESTYTRSLFGSPRQYNPRLID